MFTAIGNVIALIGFGLSLLMITLPVLIMYSNTYVGMATTAAAAVIGAGVALLIGSTLIGIMAEISQRVKGGV